MGCKGSKAVAGWPTSFAQVVPDELPPPCRRKADVVPERKKCFDQQLKYALDQEIGDRQEQAQGAVGQAGDIWEQARGSSSSSGQAPAPDLPISADAKEQVLVDILPEEPRAMRPSHGLMRQSQPEEAGEQRGQQPERREKEERKQQAEHCQGEGGQQIQLQRPREDREPEHSEKMINQAPPGDKEMEQGERLMIKVDTMKSVPSDSKSPLSDLVAGDLKMVSEPKGLVTYQSYNYDPTAEDFAAGHPIASCGPSHRRHLRRLRKYLKSLVTFPQPFKDKVAARRQKIDERRKRQDAVAEKSPIVDVVQDEASVEARGRPNSKAKPSQPLEPIPDESMQQIA